MTRRRGHPAFSLEIVVSDDQFPRTGQIIADAPGHVDVRVTGPKTSGWVRLVLITEGEHELEDLESRLREALDLHLIYCEDRVLACSRGGKTQTRASIPLETPEDLAIAYTPGVGRVARLLALSPERVNELTGKANRVAVVTDGSDVAGLGNVGPMAALPVMEGKAALLARLAGIDAVPICLHTQDVTEILSAVTAIAPAFGAINLVDISAPRCFEVETRLRDTLDIPVIHDEQHGTALVVLAAMLNALQVVAKPVETARIVLVGAGAAMTTLARLFLAADAREVTVWTPQGAAPHPSLERQPPEPSQIKHKRWLAHRTDPRDLASGISGGRGLAEALTQADAVVVSVPDVISRSHFKKMAKEPIVFALGDPPAVDHDLADVAAVVATGSSEYPNQVTNALAFPGLLRGVLGTPVARLDEPALLAAAYALASLTQPASATRLLPDVVDPRVAPAIAAAVQDASATSA